MADLPISLPPILAAELSLALDAEGKIPRALDALGPIGDRDVVLVGGGAEETRRLSTIGARITKVEPLNGSPTAAWPLPTDSADAVVAAWSGFRGVDGRELDEAHRILRPGGRLLVVHDYGRDDVSRLRGDQPEYSDWSRRDGPFLSAGFRIRVVHCFWTFGSVTAAQAFLAAAFGPAGQLVADELKRPRLSYNVAIYHRDRIERS